MVPRYMPRYRGATWNSGPHRLRFPVESALNTRNMRSATRRQRRVPPCNRYGAEPEWRRLRGRDSHHLDQNLVSVNGPKPNCAPRPLPDAPRLQPSIHVTRFFDQSMSAHSADSVPACGSRCSCRGPLRVILSFHVQCRTRQLGTRLPTVRGANRRRRRDISRSGAMVPNGQSTFRAELYRRRMAEPMRWNGRSWRLGSRSADHLHLPMSRCSSIRIEDTHIEPGRPQHSSAAISASLLIVLMLRAVPFLVAGSFSLDVPMPAG